MKTNDGHLNTGSRRGTCSPLYQNSGLTPPTWILDDMEMREKVGDALANKKGPICSKCTGAAPGCCYQVVGISYMEAHIIVNRLGKGRLAAMADEIAERGAQELAHFGKGPMYNGADHAKKAAEWMQKKLPCVFMTPGGACSIYRFRPWACVTYFAVGGSPAGCAPDNDKPIGVLDTGGIFLRGNDQKSLKDELTTHVLGNSMDMEGKPLFQMGIAAALWLAITD